MGLNEYGKRLKMMNSQCHSIDRKKPRFSAHNHFSIYSGLLDPFELRKKDLALPSVRRTDPFRSDSKFGTSLMPPFCSPVFRRVQGGQGNSAIRLMHVARAEQNYRSQMNDSRVPEPQITGIAQQGLHFSQNTICAGDSEQTGNLLYTRWRKEKDNLNEAQNLRENDNLKEAYNLELEEYKKMVQAADDPPSLPETSEFERIYHLQELPQLAGEPNLSSKVTLDQSTMASALRSKDIPLWKQMLEESNRKRDPRIEELEAEVKLATSQLKSLQVTEKEVFPASEQRSRDELDDKGRSMSVAFTPLSMEEEEEVDHALTGHNRHEVLAMHKESNIDITRTVMQCLKPGVWLNDEVINLYMELLRERGQREPKKFLKCHFFNTFFFNKLYKDKKIYDYKAVRRWTTQKKLGYNLLECDKIFIPIHKDIHWCLAIINMRDKKFQYLDSLKGRDRSALQVLAKYLKDEARDKLNQILDVDTWDQDYPQDIPEQRNGCDCGMFMIKYADFHSRGDQLIFTQEHMEYFRRRTVLELLQLRAR